MISIQYFSCHLSCQHVFKQLGLNGQSTSLSFISLIRYICGRAGLQFSPFGCMHIIFVGKGTLEAIAHWMWLEHGVQISVLHKRLYYNWAVLSALFCSISLIQTWRIKTAVTTDLVQFGTAHTHLSNSKRNESFDAPSLVTH